MIISGQSINAIDEREMPLPLDTAAVGRRRAHCSACAAGRAGDCTAAADEPPIFDKHPQMRPSFFIRNHSMSQGKLWQLNEISAERLWRLRPTILREWWEKRESKPTRGLSKDLYQVKETWKVSFSHSFVCFDPKNLYFKAKIDPFSHFYATQTVLLKIVQCEETPFLYIHPMKTTPSNVVSFSVQ